MSLFPRRWRFRPRLWGNIDNDTQGCPKWDGLALLPGARVLPKQNVYPSIILLQGLVDGHDEDRTIKMKPICKEQQHVEFFDHPKDLQGNGDIIRKRVGQALRMLPLYRVLILCEGLPCSLPCHAMPRSHHVCVASTTCTVFCMHLDLHLIPI